MLLYHVYYVHVDKFSSFLLLKYQYDIYIYHPAGRGDVRAEEEASGLPRGGPRHPWRPDERLRHRLEDQHRAPWPRGRRHDLHALRGTAQLGALLQGAVPRGANGRSWG